MAHFGSVLLSSVVVLSACLFAASAAFASASAAEGVQDAEAIEFIYADVSTLAAGDAQLVVVF